MTHYLSIKLLSRKGILSIPIWVIDNILFLWRISRAFYLKKFPKSISSRGPSSIFPSAAVVVVTTAGNGLTKIS